jgi:hypothetical protein
MPRSRSREDTGEEAKVMDSGGGGPELGMGGRAGVGFFFLNSSGVT